MPCARNFLPAGDQAAGRVVLELDELEAVRLADLEGLYQQEAARRMNVSRATFGRILAGARRKLAQAVVGGQELVIEGGTIELAQDREFNCRGCGRLWQEAVAPGRPQCCPGCGSRNIDRADSSGEHCRKAGYAPGAERTEQ